MDKFHNTNEYGGTKLSPIYGQFLLQLEKLFGQIKVQTVMILSYFPAILLIMTSLTHNTLSLIFPQAVIFHKCKVSTPKTSGDFLQIHIKSCVERKSIPFKNHPLSKVRT